MLHEPAETHKLCLCIHEIGQRLLTLIPGWSSPSTLFGARRYFSGRNKLQRSPQSEAHPANAAHDGCDRKHVCVRDLNFNLMLATTYEDIQSTFVRSPLMQSYCTGLYSYIQMTQPKRPLPDNSKPSQPNQIPSL